MSAGFSPTGVRLLNQRGQWSDFSKSTREKRPSASRASQCPASLWIWVSLPSVSIFHRPVLMSATKTLPFSSTTRPELGWAQTRPANRVTKAMNGVSRAKQARHMMHLRLRRRTTTQLPTHRSILISCSRPFLLTSFSAGLAPRARIWTCAGFDSPTKLIPDPSSDAPILTLGAPLELISRSSTLSGYPVVPSGILAVGSGGNTLIIARTRPWSSTISRPRPRSMGATSADTAGLARNSVYVRINKFTTVNPTTNRCDFMTASFPLVSGYRALLGLLLPQNLLPSTGAGHRPSPKLGGNGR